MAEAGAVWPGGHVNINNFAVLGDLLRVGGAEVVWLSGSAWAFAGDVVVAWQVNALRGLLVMCEGILIDNII